MGHLVHFVFIAMSLPVMAMACLMPSVHAADSASGQMQVASSTDLRITTDVIWKRGLFNNEPKTYLEVSLITQGGEAVRAIACGNIDLDSIKDENGHPVKPVGLTSLGGMLLVSQENAVVKHPKGGVRVWFDLYDPPPLKKLSELRGSFALRTGGRLQEVILKDALRQTSGAIDDATLKNLGVAVHVARTTRQTPAESERKSFTFTVPGEPDDAQDVLEFDIRNGETAVGGYAYPAQQRLQLDAKAGERSAVVRIEMTDANGKPFKPMTSNVSYGDSIGKAKFCFKERLPNSSQLRLTIHRDSREIRVPFALKDIDIPPKKELDELQPFSLTPIPSVEVPLLHAISPLQPEQVAPAGSKEHESGCH